MYPGKTIDAGQNRSRCRKGLTTGNFQANPECQELKEGDGPQLSFPKPVIGPKKASQVSAETSLLQGPP